MTDFHHTNDVKATRKGHPCFECLITIPAGSPAVRVTGKYEGDFYSYTIHPDCQQAMETWTKVVYPASSESFEWYGLIEEVSNVERSEAVAILADYPAVIERLWLDKEG